MWEFLKKIYISGFISCTFSQRNYLLHHLYLLTDARVLTCNFVSTSLETHSFISRRQWSLQVTMTLQPIGVFWVKFENWNYWSICKFQKTERLNYNFWKFWGVNLNILGNLRTKMQNLKFLGVIWNSLNLTYKILHKFPSF